MKSPVKNFHGRAKGGGHRTVPPPKYATERYRDRYKQTIGQMQYVYTALK